MIDSAIDLLLSAYKKDDEIADVRNKRKYIAEMLNIFSKEAYDTRLKEIEKLNTNAKTSEELENFKMKKFEELEVFKIQYDAYNAMNFDIMNFDKISKQMKKDIKNVKAYYKKVRDMTEKIENIRIEWS